MTDICRREPLPPQEQPGDGILFVHGVRSLDDAIDSMNFKYVAPCIRACDSHIVLPHRLGMTDSGNLKLIVQ